MRTNLPPFMKKIYLTLALCILAIIPVFSQDTLKISQGMFSTELNINPFIGQLSFNNAIKQIKFRYFTTDQSALRIAFTINTLNKKLEDKNPYGTNSFNFKDIRKSTEVGLNLGYEKHFNGTKRLSPYIGAEVALSNKSSSQTSSQNNVETKVKGAWLTNSNFEGTNYAERAYFSYGLNLISGFDFYIARHFYFGYELGFGFTNKKYKDIDITTLNAPGSTFGGNNQSERDENDFVFGPNLVNGIRLGFVF